MQIIDYSYKGVDTADELCNIKYAVIVNVHRVVRVLASTLTLLVACVTLALAS